MLNNSAIIHELRIIGKRWNIPLLYEAADELERMTDSYDQLWFDHNRMIAMYDHQNRRNTVKFFTPTTLANEEPDENVIYVNSEMVSWVRKATRDEIEDYFKYGGI